MKNQQHHILISCLAAQGHLNPTFQLAKSLARAGARVTFATTVYGFSRIKNLPSFSGLSFASFSDGYDDAESRKNIKFDSFFADLTHVGSKNLTKLIQTLSDEDRPVTFLIYGIMMPWAAEVASGMNIPSAFLSFQCAAALAIYHKYFNSQDGVYDGVRKIEPSISVKLPDLPLFENCDLPTILVPTDPQFASGPPIFHEHIRALEKDSKPCVLVNTFAELEEASIRAIVDHMNVIPIGPLLPCVHSNGNDLFDKSVSLDLFECHENDYLQWLDSKPEKSVVYTAFGSLTKLKKDEKLEILHGLEETGRHYMIVMRAVENEDEEVKEMMENGLNGKGKIVPWCSQMEVLCHKSIGCFLTHCGWNSTLESLVAGVPIVGCPHFADQTTNAKLIEEVWSNGVRAKANEDGVVGREEIKRCVDVLMGGGEKEEEIRRNAAKWRGLALEAMKENGSSHNNFKLFLDSLDN
ncbi:UDP-glycosyltransferase 75C1-like [Coffea eugenioides]|uniref:UDP-glycosyltransferase 75C1-like n=1 Tax=Coffea eugenioides TaxID=49369 RepID=UPI000F6063AD|nr:UDP-glycosyltransferase 75C1-like [Coffea eugenioides]